MIHMISVAALRTEGDYEKTVVHLPKWILQTVSWISYFKQLHCNDDAGRQEAGAEFNNKQSDTKQENSLDMNTEWILPEEW